MRLVLVALWLEKLQTLFVSTIMIIILDKFYYFASVFLQSNNIIRKHHIISFMFGNFLTQFLSYFFVENNNDLVKIPWKINSN